MIGNLSSFVPSIPPLPPTSCTTFTAPSISTSFSSPSVLSLLAARTDSQWREQTGQAITDITQVCPNLSVPRDTRPTQTPRPLLPIAPQLDCMLSPLGCNFLGTAESTSFLGILPMIVRRVRVGVRVPVFLYTSPMITALSDKDQYSLRAQAASDNNYAHVSHVCSNAHDEPEQASSVKSSSLLTPHTEITDLTAPARGSSLHSVD
jgi:hypothetical protein